jgi:hypothetical protein
MVLPMKSREFSREEYFERKIAISQQSNVTDYFDKVSLTQGGCDAFGWKFTKNFAKEIFICPDPEKCPGTCPEGYPDSFKCLECWGTDQGRDACQSRGCINMSLPGPPFDAEEEEFRCIAPVSFTKNCINGLASIGCNSCASGWYQDPDMICRKCGVAGGNSMIIMAFFSPFLVGYMYRAFNKDQAEDEAVTEAKERMKEDMAHKEEEDEDDVPFGEVNVKKLNKADKELYDQICQQKAEEDDMYAHDPGGMSREDLTAPDKRGSVQSHVSVAELQDLKYKRMKEEKFWKWCLHRAFILFQETKDFVVLFYEEVYTVIKDCFELLVEFGQAAAIVTSFEINWREIVDFNEGAAPEHQLIKEILALRKILGANSEAITAKLGLKQGCATKSFEQRYQFAICLPLLFTMIFFFNYYVVNHCMGPLRGSLSRCYTSRVNKGKKGRCTKMVGLLSVLKIDWDKTYNAVGTLVVTLYLSICRNSLSLFIKFKHPGGAEGLTLYPEVFSKSQAWYNVLPLGIFGLIIYFFGIFTLLISVCYFGPLNYHDEGFRQKWFFLFDGLKPDIYWWRVCVLLRALLLNLTMTTGSDSRLQIVMCNLIYTLAVSASFLFKPYPTRVQNTIDVCCGLAMITLLSAVSFHLRSKDKVGQNLDDNSWLTWMEGGSLIFPVLSMFACACIPMYAFYHRIANMTHTFNLAQRFRDLMFVCISKDNNFMNNFIKNLNDDERSVMNALMGICYSHLLKVQPADNWMERVLIDELPHESDKVLYGTEDVVLSHLVEIVKEDDRAIYTPLRERIFIQWFLDELIGAYHKHHKDDPTILDIFDELFRRSGAIAPPPPLDRELTGENFCLGCRLLCPTVSAGEAKRVFAIVDTDGSNCLSQEEFEIVFTGMAGDAGCISRDEKEDRNDWSTRLMNAAKLAWQKSKEAKEKAESLKKSMSTLGHSPKVDKSQSSIQIDISQVEALPERGYYMSMRDALSKLHIILDADEGSERKMRAWRMMDAQRTITKFLRARKKAMTQQASDRANAPDVDEDSLRGLGITPDEWDAVGTPRSEPGGKVDEYPNGDHPNGEHPNGDHPNGENGGHPNGEYPNGKRTNGASSGA